MTRRDRARKLAMARAHAERRDARRPKGATPSADELRNARRDERRKARRAAA